MARQRGTSRDGSPFSATTGQAVWNKGKAVPGTEPALKRKDTCGAWIDRYQYGVTKENGTGWEIDHIKPVSQGGSDDLSNLQPLRWENNRSKGDDYPNFKCARCA